MTRLPLAVVGLLVALALFVFVVVYSWAANALAATTSSAWRSAIASAYSTADSPGTQGCPPHRPLNDVAHTFASFAVPCGAHVRFCAHGRCVTATRTDSGPYVAGRTFDLALGTVHALGFRSARDFGVRTIRWRRV